jgi:hypothetical protein
MVGLQTRVLEMIAFPVIKQLPFVALEVIIKMA